MDFGEFPRGRLGSLKRRIGNFLAIITRAGSPCRIIDRTFSATFKLPQAKAIAKLPPQPKLYRNPVALALEWQRRLQSGEAKSRADLARQLGVSRAHVTQTLRLFRLSTTVKQAVLALGDPRGGRKLGAHTLRSITRLPGDEQERRILEMIKGLKP